MACSKHFHTNYFYTLICILKLLILVGKILYESMMSINVHKILKIMHSYFVPPMLFNDFHLSTIEYNIECGTFNEEYNSIYGLMVYLFIHKLTF